MYNIKNTYNGVRAEIADTTGIDKVLATVLFVIIPALWGVVLVLSALALNIMAINVVIAVVENNNPMGLVSYYLPNAVMLVAISAAIVVAVLITLPYSRKDDYSIHNFTM